MHLPHFGISHANMKKKRPYRQTARAEAAEQTRRSIMQAAVVLWRRMDLEEMTLGDVAKEAGVSVQTVIRKFGSKEGVVDAVIENRAAEVYVQRDQAPEDDPEAALDVLLEHYEGDGDAVLRTLAIEHRSAAAARVASEGRRSHRAWCERVFAPYLPSRRAKAFETRLDAFVAATDIYVWKVLRRDLGRSAARTRQALGALVAGLICESEGGGRR